MKRYLAELFGTFALVFAGAGAIVVNDVYSGVIGHLGIAITFGLVVMVMIYTIGEVSGAHINPAVTIAFWIAGKFNVKDVIPYIVFQTIGAILASYLLVFLFPEATTMGETLPSGTWQQTFLMEFVLTFILMFVITNVSTGAKETGIMAGAAIGATVALDALIGGPVSGASMNPARSVGPAIAAGEFTHLWIYIVAPIAGAAIGVFGCKLIRPKGCCDVPVEQA